MTDRADDRSIGCLCYPGRAARPTPHRASLPRSAGKLISAEAPRAGGNVGVMSSDPQQGDSTPTLSDLEVVLGRDLAVTDDLTEGELFAISNLCRPSAKRRSQYLGFSDTVFQPPLYRTNGTT